MYTHTHNNVCTKVRTTVYGGGRGLRVSGLLGSERSAGGLYIMHSGLVLTNTTDLLNCFIGMDSNLYTASCALNSLWVRNAEPTFLNWTFNSSVLASAATRLNNSPMDLSVFIMYEATYITQA